MFGSGISSLGCLLDAAEGVDVVQRKGSWYSFGDQKLGQGREKTMAILAESKDMQRYASLDLQCQGPCHLCGRHRTCITNKVCHCVYVQCPKAAQYNLCLCFSLDNPERHELFDLLCVKCTGHDLVIDHVVAHI